MKKNSLVANKGLSLSQAQSISNLCNQSAIEIDMKLSAINNFSKKIKVDGELIILKTGNQIPSNVQDLLINKGRFHACQAFLMENIKAKESLLEQAKTKKFKPSTTPPKAVSIVDYSVDTIPLVGEEFGWSQLSLSELNEYYEAEAMASHIGQFIHGRGILTRLREELPNVPNVDWFVVKEGEKTMVFNNVHHTSEELFKIHENLSEIHRKYEQRVNYFKAKVKNLTTAENSRISKINSVESEKSMAKYEGDVADWRVKYDEYLKFETEEKNKFEEDRLAEISEISSMRINVDQRFGDIINKFLNTLNREE